MYAPSITRSFTAPTVDAAANDAVQLRHDVVLLLWTRSCAAGTSVKESAVLCHACGYPVHQRAHKHIANCHVSSLPLFVVVSLVINSFVS